VPHALPPALPGPRGRRGLCHPQVNLQGGRSANVVSVCQARCITESVFHILPALLAAGDQGPGGGMGQDNRAGGCARAQGRTCWRQRSRRGDAMGSWAGRSGAARLVPLIGGAGLVGQAICQKGARCSIIRRKGPMHGKQSEERALRGPEHQTAGAPSLGRAGRRARRRIKARAGASRRTPGAPFTSSAPAWGLAPECSPCTATVRAARPRPRQQEEPQPQSQQRPSLRGARPYAEVRSQ
jgi:hypothetical protein